MTTDNQTIENPDALKDLDIYCQITEQTALEKISDAWHDLQSQIEYFNYCDNKFPIDKRDNAQLISGYSLKELDDCLDLSRLMESTIDLRDLDTEKFDALTRDVYQIIAEWMSHGQKTKGELATLQESQVSKTKSTQQELTWAGERITSKEEEIKKLGSAILIEGAFLFAALILGFGAGIWGAVIAVIVVLVWRSGTD